VHRMGKEWSAMSFGSKMEIQKIQTTVCNTFVWDMDDS
jgi:hypothetical protein